MLSPAVNEIDVDAPHTKVETACSAALDDCNRLRCPYGIERFVDEAGCERCRCHDVCEGHQCDDGMQCAIDLYENPETGNTEFRAVCRPGTAYGALVDRPCHSASEIPF